MVGNPEGRKKSLHNGDANNKFSKEATARCCKLSVWRTVCDLRIRLANESLAALDEKLGPIQDWKSTEPLAKDLRTAHSFSVFANKLEKTFYIFYAKMFGSV